MAKAQNNKPQGQFRQMLGIYKITAQQDKMAVVLSVGAFLIALIAAIVYSTTAFPGNVVNLVIFIVLGTLIGVLLSMIIMGRRAERAAYSRIAGQTGATGAVLGSQLRRGWRSSEMPVAVNPRSQDAVYRAIGPGGVMLIGEGNRGRVKILLEDERKKVSRVAPGAPINFIYVTNDEGATALADLAKTLYKSKKVMNRSEISAVAKRLESLGMNIPIPKGIDPSKLGKMRRG